MKPFDIPNTCSPLCSRLLIPGCREGENRAPLVQLLPEAGGFWRGREREGTRGLEPAGGSGPAAVKRSHPHQDLSRPFCCTLTTRAEAPERDISHVHLLSQ
ncbi:unnamed protein product [Pleuronectes platessa]|uniref:Uncharacterized protein n=1 Tax=Pleuronectes platessa TaxID=8262 RepID=A0A9N7UYK6_PLEPL|nr:unnamed protein product [Pleuronectes platessa]